MTEYAEMLYRPIKILQLFLPFVLFADVNQCNSKMFLEHQVAGQRPPTTPPTKFKWTDDTSVMLLEEVGNNEAHIPPYGKQEKCFVQVVECLNKRGVQVTSAWTCQRHFEKLLKSCLKKDEADAGASGKEPDDEGISVNVIGIHLHHAALTDQEWIRAQRFISDQCCLIYFSANL